MNRKEFIDDVVLEWAFRLENGQPDLLNENHLLILQDILYEKDIPNEIVFEWINNIRINSNENLNSITTAAFLNNVKTHTTRSIDATTGSINPGLGSDHYIVPDGEDTEDTENVEENVENIMRYLVKDNKLKEQTKIDIKQINLESIKEVEYNNELLYELDCGLVVKRDELDRYTQGE